MKVDESYSDNKLLRQHGITKQVIIPLNHIKLSLWTVLQNAKCKRAFQPKSRIEMTCDEKLLKLHGITKQVSILLSREFFPKRRTQRTRFRKRPRNDPYKCPYPDCKYKAVYYSIVNAHMKIKHSAERPFKCQECSKTFKTASILERHGSFHSREKKIACSYPGCNWKSRYPHNLKIHMILHTEEKTHKCSMCGWRTRWKQQLKLHMQVHGAEMKKYSCEKCDFVSKSMQYLKVHVQIKHLDPTLKPAHLQCPHCKYSAFHIRYLKKHLKRHSNTKLYRCHFCSYKSVSSCHLNRHVRTHTGEKPYSCSKCEFEAISKDRVNQHHKTHHEKRVKNHKCNFCQKTFLAENGLGQHMSSHTGEKPYTCAFCKLMFSYSSARDIHKKKCHNRPRAY